MDNSERLLNDWHLRVTTAQFGHQQEADRNRLAGLWLGIPVVVASTLVGTSVFAAIGRHVGGGPAALVGSISVLAAVLASVQTFLGYSQVSERHRVAAARYAAIRRTIEIMLTDGDRSDLKRVQSELDKVGAASPLIGAKRWKQATREARQAIKEWHEGDRQATEPAMELG